jgi:hypothetical protein
LKTKGCHPVKLILRAFFSITKTSQAFSAGAIPSHDDLSKNHPVQIYSAAAPVSIGVWTNSIT